MPVTHNVRPGDSFPGWLAHSQPQCRAKAKWQGQPRTVVYHPAGLRRHGLGSEFNARADPVSYQRPPGDNWSAIYEGALIACGGGTDVNCGDPGKRKDSQMLLGRRSWIKTARALAPGNTLRAVPAPAEADSLIASKSVFRKSVLSGRSRDQSRLGA